jgi:hypothetical protein
MTQRFDRIKWIAEAVRVGGVRHELRDPFRAPAADGPCVKTALLPDEACEKLDWKRVLGRCLLQCTANVGCGWLGGRLYDLATRRRRGGACLCTGVPPSQGEHPGGEQRASQSGHASPMHVIGPHGVIRVEC